jgi:hypothetical protein
MISAPVRDQVERREVLEDAHRVVRADHADRARQADALRARGAGREHDGRRGDDEVGPVMLADAEHVEPDLVGQLDLLQQVAHALARRARRQLPERVDPELHRASTIAASALRRAVSLDCSAPLQLRRWRVRTDRAARSTRGSK